MRLLIISLSSILIVACSVNHSEIKPSRAGSSSEGQKEEEFFKRTNQFRKQMGRHTFEYHEGLSRLARAHAQSMAKGQRGTGHSEFSYRSNYAQVYYGMDYVSENVSRTTRPDQVGWTLDAWMQSRSHRENLMSKLLYCGVGVARSANGEWFLVQLYASPDLGHPLHGSSPRNWMNAPI